ncbi:MAG: nitroreductase family protein [Phascolarctobacterium sp.]|nr:nitroreductase family protein [Phascolarctobacterium sp.]
MEKIATVLKAAYASPVGHNEYHGLHISVIQSAPLLQDLAVYCGKTFGNEKYNPFYDDPTLIIVSAKPEEDGQLVYIADVCCVMENMHLAATELGLGCVFLWPMLNRIPQSPAFLEAIALPEGFKPISALALGYPQIPLSKRTLQDITNNKIATDFIL